ncbi:UNVERIFIED_CONTAM: hypothetical protein FKN15_054258 [Acipenser sinensis]
MEQRLESKMGEEEKEGRIVGVAEGDGEVTSQKCLMNAKLSGTVCPQCPTADPTGQAPNELGRTLAGLSFVLQRPLTSAFEFLGVKEEAGLVVGSTFSFPELCGELLW